MKINKISLYNFNSYEGLNEFDFTSDDPKRNIILIGGKNGTGKTSLFTAIKIALYGPLSYGYIGVNPHYIAKIKECINSNSFQKDVVISRVQILVSLIVEREVKEYEITREWDYTHQKLEEKYYVKIEGRLLDGQELTYFQNYLQGMIPPNLFEFFLFDGEAVGSIFSTKAYNSYVKNAIYTLCGLDIFEIIRKYTTGYVGKANNEEEEQIYNQYEELRQQVERLEETYLEIEEQISADEEALGEIETELIEVETAFKKTGGIAEVERQALLKELAEAEHTKTESLMKIKMFVEGLMPFVIVRDITSQIAEQLDFEEEGEFYCYVERKLSRQDIKNVLSSIDNISDEALDALMEHLLKKFKPKGYREGIQPVHDLSREDAGRVHAMISSIDDFDVDGMVELVEKKKVATDRTMEINRILKSTMADEDIARYTERENALLKKKDEIVVRMHENQIQMVELKEQLSLSKQQKDRAFQNLKNNAQNKHVVGLSSRLSQMMNTILSNKSVSIKRKLEELIVEKLQHIYRKNNLITHIEIEEDFQFNLYQNVQYSTIDLLHLIKNLGKDAFAAEIGKQGLQRLYDKYGGSSITQLQQSLSPVSEKKEVDLFKRIDINRLSKGERQIFILSLYWAIIELSGQDIPFVIDTPYARIDANHRKEISEKFFPNISKQVIILSTDEEINEEYYEIIKPYIAREYLLVNDENQNRTTVKQHYFFGV